MTTHSSMAQASYVPRARRYQIEAPVLYRRPGQVDWTEGRSENISSSGILFRGNRVLETGMSVELGFKFFAERNGGEGAVVMCQAQIVRSVLPPLRDAPPALAARILAYWFVREEDESDG